MFLSNKEINLFICVGISGCGKSTWAKTYLESNPNAVELNRDHVRFNILYPNATDYHSAHFEDRRKQEQQVTYYIHDLFYKAIEEGKDIVISDSNLSRTTRYKWERFARKHNLKLNYVVFKTAFEDTFFHNPQDIMKLSNYTLEIQYPRFKEFLEQPPISAANYLIV